jgi:hypothetical protein
MLYVRFPLSLRNVEDLLHERGIDISHETVRFWWNRFGPLFAAEIRKKRVSQMRSWGCLAYTGRFQASARCVGVRRRCRLPFLTGAHQAR